MPSQDIAPRLRSFGPIAILAIVIILAGNILFAPLSAILVLVWAQESETPWNELGFVRPRSWPLAILGGIVLGAALKLFLKIIVMPLLGAPTVNSAYHYLAGNRAAIPFTLYMLIIGAGFGEETLYRGFMFERLGRLLGSSTSAKIGIVVFTSLVFGAPHYPVQGLAGAEQAVITGLVFGSIFMVTRSIAMLMIAHASFDLVAYAIIYFNLETRFAHLLFR
jgi:CAAX protease family protein